MKRMVVHAGDRVADLRELPAPLALDELVPGEGSWEVEIGFGKGRYLLHRAAEQVSIRFVGIEMAYAYHRLASRRMQSRSIANVALIRGEALLVLAAYLPRGFAAAVHVYFPDPWPKARHHKRRLFDPETVDLVLGLLRPGGELFFATDFIDYGAAVRSLLESHPGVEVETVAGAWPDGARTNYEAKYEAEGREILRLRATWQPASEGRTLHPEGAAGILAATSVRVDEAEPAT